MRDFSSSGSGAKFSNLPVTTPVSSMMKVHSWDTSPHSCSSGDGMPRERSPCISCGFSYRSI